MTFAQLTEYAKRLAVMQGRAFTGPDDDWTISVVVDFGDAQPHVLRLPGWLSNDDEAKDALAHALAGAARLTKPRQVALVQSAWMRFREDDDDNLLDGVMPRDHPARVEAVFIVVLDTEVEAGHWARIHRRRRRPPALGEWETFPGKGGDVAGRLIDPLRQALR